jgi:DNA-binding response OmpR family regulator
LATILVVDDQPQICKMLASVLQDEGFAVLTAPSGSEALRIARSCTHGLDLLLSDLDMPDMDGSSLAQQLRDQCPGLPIILMSGGWSPDVMNIPTPATFLPKPFSLAILARMAHTMTGA